MSLSFISLSQIYEGIKFKNNKIFFSFLFPLQVKQRWLLLSFLLSSPFPNIYKCFLFLFSSLLFLSLFSFSSPLNCYQTKWKENSTESNLGVQVGILLLFGWNALILSILWSPSKQRNKVGRCEKVSLLFLWDSINISVCLICWTQDTQKWKWLCNL